MAIKRITKPPPPKIQEIIQSTKIILQSNHLNTGSNIQKHLQNIEKMLFYLYKHKT